MFSLLLTLPSPSLIQYRTVGTSNTRVWQGKERRRKRGCTGIATVVWANVPYRKKWEKIRALMFQQQSQQRVNLGIKKRDRQTAQHLTGLLLRTQNSIACKATFSVGLSIACSVMPKSTRIYGAMKWYCACTISRMQRNPLSWRSTSECCVLLGKQHGLWGMGGRVGGAFFLVFPYNAACCWTNVACRLI